MTLDAYSGSEIDLTDPGTLSFATPDGSTLTSDGGFSPTPEPATFLLLGAGLVIVLVRHKSCCTAGDLVAGDFIADPSTG